MLLVGLSLLLFVVVRTRQRLWWKMSQFSDQWKCAALLRQGSREGPLPYEWRCYSRLSKGGEREPLFSGSLGDSYSVLSVTPRRYSL